MIKKLNGAGTIYDLPNGKVKYELRYTDENDECRRHTMVFNRRSDAEKERKRYALHNSKGLFFSVCTVEEFGNYVLLEMSKNDDRLDSSIIREKQVLLNQIIPHIGTERMDDLTTDMIQDMIGNIKETQSASTAKKAYLLMKKIVNYYRNVNKLSKDIMKGVAHPCKNVREKETVFFSQEEVEKICEAATRKDDDGKYVYRYGNAVALIAHTGMRVGEALALTWNNVDFEKNEIRIYNTITDRSYGECNNILYGQQAVENKDKYSSRTIKFTPFALEMLKSLKEQSGNSKYVVCNKKGEIVRETYVNREFHKILDAVKIKVDKGGGVNILRDSFGLFLANNNFTPENIACILGFAKESSTEKYFADKKHKEFIEKCAENEFFN